MGKIVDIKAKVALTKGWAREKGADQVPFHQPIIPNPQLSSARVVGMCLCTGR